MRSLYHFLLVAEKSLIDIIPITIKSIEKYGNPESISIIVPSGEIDKFRRLELGDVELIPEDAVLPAWPLKRIKSKIPFPDRAGWYLQQFLKLEFGDFAKLSKYVIWDADTIMLSKINFQSGDQTILNLSREYHEPYFSTYRKIFDHNPQLKRSAISQYILIDNAVCFSMKQEIIKGKEGDDWIDVVLGSLSGTSESEFSEYETYANYLYHFSPSKIELRASKWFRYGAEIFPDWSSLKLETIERYFSGYAYVAFERHRKKRLRFIMAHIARVFRA
jgi:hypothetical protein